MIVPPFVTTIDNVEAETVTVDLLRHYGQVGINLDTLTLYVAMGNAEELRDRLIEVLGPPDGYVKAKE